MQASDKNKINVTVVIPCHNHADMLGEAIDSVISQSHRPLRIIVVDDGSVDSPEQVVEEKVAPDVKIDFIRNDKALGPSAARNRAFEKSWNYSDVFMMLDADDRYLPGKIEKSVEKFMENPSQIGIVYTDAVITNCNKKTQIHEFRQPFSRESLEKECIISNTPLLNKKAIADSGGYDETMRTCEDWDLWLRITEKMIAVHIPEPLHIYSVTGKNASDVVPQEVWNENWRKISIKLAERKNGISR